VDDAPVARDRANLLLGRVVGAVVSLPVALILVVPALDAHDGERLLGELGALGLVTTSTGIGGWAGRAIGRRESGGGARYGVVSALPALAILAAAAAGVDYVHGRKRGIESLIGAFALVFFGLVPALVVGLLAGLVLSGLVKRPTLPRG
jgi:hypothetical protein